MTPALELAALHKRFGSVEALVEASLTVRHGSVHALLGENGAGKSTLMRIAFGMLRPDRGTVRVSGEEVELRSSADAIARRIGMVHQHFTLVPAMTVAENVALGMRGRYRADEAAARVRTLGEQTGLALDPGARAETLPVGAQQRLEILKALARDARILILDEPTAVLAPREADDLLRWIRRFADDGHAVVLITHKLREALAVADDVTVLRRGRTVLASSVAATREADLVSALLGDESAPAVSPAIAGPRAPGPSLPVVARLERVSVAGAGGTTSLHDLSLDVHGGEILGVAAVEGSGQHALLRLLAGRLAPTSGTIALPRAVAFIPEDRHRDGMVLDMSLVENVALRGLDARRGRMPWRDVASTTRELLARFHVRASSPASPGRSLSGGNQQKLVLARELDEHPPLVVAENPTRGLDIRATAAVQLHLREARDAGSAVVLYSSDLDEVLALADRMVALHAGRLIAVEPATRESVGRAMLGAG